VTWCGVLYLLRWSVCSRAIDRKRDTAGADAAALYSPLGLTQNRLLGGCLFVPLVMYAVVTEKVVEAFSCSSQPFCDPDRNPAPCSGSMRPVVVAVAVVSMLLFLFAAPVTGRCIVARHTRTLVAPPLAPEKHKKKKRKKKRRSKHSSRPGHSNTLSESGSEAAPLLSPLDRAHVPLLGGPPHELSAHIAEVDDSTITFLIEVRVYCWCCT